MRAAQAVRYDGMALELEEAQAQLKEHDRQHVRAATEIDHLRAYLRSREEELAQCQHDAKVSAAECVSQVC